MISIVTLKISMGISHFTGNHMPLLAVILSLTGTPLVFADCFFFKFMAFSFRQHICVVAIYIFLSHVTRSMSMRQTKLVQ